MASMHYCGHLDWKTILKWVYSIIENIYLLKNICSTQRVNAKDTHAD